MKQIILYMIVIVAFSMNVAAQELSNDDVFAIETTEIYAPEDSISQAADIDTAIVRIGKKDVKVIDHDHGTEIVWGKGKNKKHNPEDFEGHWEGLEFGFNGFDKPNYSMYATKDFMSLNQGKSMEIDFNFYELNIGLIGSYVGLVSGMGLNFNSYRFENPYTLVKGVTITEPVLLGYEDLSKTKLAVSYLNIPLLFEIQLPVNHGKDRIYMNAGVIGGVKIGSHTKVKHGDTKDKDHSGFNLNPFKYEATARIGYKDFGLFAKYSQNPLFQSDKGPVLTPFTIGISFLD
ncbi:MAG: outer membrane beta-barrel protein [Prolixibacteraceae bacterium]